jgi:hypothetical protein
MEAYLDGYEIQRCGKHWNPKESLKPDWCDTDEPCWDFDNCDYRIKPTATIRPWTADEVPLGCILKTKSTNSVWLLIGRNNVGEILIAGDKYQSPEWLLREYEHSTDGGKTWLPCGVVEEAK